MQQKQARIFELSVAIGDLHYEAYVSCISNTRTMKEIRDEYLSKVEILETELLYLQGD